MSELKKNLLKKVAKASEKVAVISCGKASILDTYQPKVPDLVRELKAQTDLKK